MKNRIRTTISLTPEAHQIFKRMSDAANISISRAMGDWLSDTSDAAELIVSKMEEAKKEPARVMREMQAMLAGMSEQVNTDLFTVRKLMKAGSSAQLDCAESQPSLITHSPPSSNTGVLVPPSRAKSTLSKRSKTETNS